MYTRKLESEILFPSSKTPNNPVSHGKLILHDKQNPPPPQPHSLCLPTTLNKTQIKIQGGEDS